MWSGLGGLLGGIVGSTIIIALVEWWRRHRTQRDLFCASKNAMRRGVIYRHYIAAARGGERDPTALVTLRAIARNAFDPSLGHEQCNPAITRLYALVALGWLSFLKSEPIPISMAEVFPGEGAEVLPREGE